MIKASIVCDSISPGEVRLTTYKLIYPRFIHAEVMTHRVFSRNASSSRAEPVSKHIERVEKEYALPYHWGKNQSGMQAEAQVTEETKETAKEIWLKAKNSAIEYAKELAALGIHKQIANRILEPFSLINVVLTATEFDNFFELRCHKDAQPEIKILADAMRVVRENSKPQFLNFGQWHLPFLTDKDKELELEKQIKMSIARCARVSYLKHDNTESTYDEDLILYNRLVNNVPRHSSPAEHTATPGYFSKFYKNFRGWIQAREFIETEKNYC